MTDTAAEKPTLPDIELVYLGLRETAGGKLAGAFATLSAVRQAKTPNAVSGSIFDFKRTKLPRAAGCVYRARGELAEDGSIARLAPHFSLVVDESIPDDFRAAFKAWSDAAAIAERTRRLEKEMAADQLAATLAPLRRDYFKTDRIGRLALEVLVLEQLRKAAP